MQTQMINVRGASLAADVFGNPRDPAVLLVMGAMSSGFWWPEDFCRALSARGRYVIRYDHRDTGRSTSNAPGDIRYSVDDLAWDALGLLDGLGMTQAHFVGMSLGGYLSQIVALVHPKRALSLTLIASELVGPQPPDLPGMSPTILAYHAQAAELDWTNRQAVIDYMVGAWRLLSGSAHVFDETLTRVLAAQDFDATPNPLTAFNHAQLGDVRTQLPPVATIKAPTLIIHGTEDPVLRYPHALALHQAIPGSQLVPLVGTGHELHPSDWSTIIDEIWRHSEPHTGTISTP